MSNNNQPKPKPESNKRAHFKKRNSFQLTRTCKIKILYSQVDTVCNNEVFLNFLLDKVFEYGSSYMQPLCYIFSIDANTLNEACENKKAPFKVSSYEELSNKCNEKVIPESLRSVKQSVFNFRFDNDPSMNLFYIVLKLLGQYFQKYCFHLVKTLFTKKNFNTTLDQIIKDILSEKK